MNLKINRVIDYGTHSSERVIIDVTGDCDLDYYMLTDTTYTSEATISNKIRHMHWFSRQDVKAGDQVVLYTKKGKANSESINGGRNTRYIRFWGLNSYVWNNSGDAALLFKINSWKTTRVVAN